MVPLPSQLESVAAAGLVTGTTAERSHLKPPAGSTGNKLEIAQGI